MKFLFVFLFALSFNSFGQSTNKIQVAILLDNSGSMSGLLDQARSTIWQIVNATSKLQIEGQSPKIEIALYNYGNTPTLLSSFNSDLDSISELLFGMQISGGDEYCGAVIQKSHKELAWSKNPKDLKFVYIAGNEGFDQGSVDYKKVIPPLCADGISLTSIYCGGYAEGINLHWQDGPFLCQGNYFNIDQGLSAQQIATPYDTTIVRYNTQLNGTYFGYGSFGEMKKMKQSSEDAKNMAFGFSSGVDRAVSKSSENYDNSQWDIVDRYLQDSTSIRTIKDSELPKEIQGKTIEEKEKFVQDKIKERKEVQQKINEANKKREAFIAEEKKRIASEGGQKDLGTTIIETMNSHATKNGYTVKQ